MVAPSRVSRSLPSRLVGTAGEWTKECSTVWRPITVRRGFVNGSVVFSPEKPIKVMTSVDIESLGMVFMVDTVAPVSTRKGRDRLSTPTDSTGSAVRVLPRRLCGACHS